MARAASTNTGPDTGQNVAPGENVDVPVEIEDAPAEEQSTPDASDGEKKYVAYTGGASTREVTRREWEQAGITGQATVQWTVANRHLVPISELSEQAVDRLLSDGGFAVVNAEDVP